MNPFLMALALLLIVAWIVCGLALVVVPGRYLWQERLTEIEGAIIALLGLATGVGMLLAFAALVTGGINLSGSDRPDGCYYIHRQLVGKTIITKYDPIPCVGVDVP